MNRRGAMLAAGVMLAAADRGGSRTMMARFDKHGVSCGEFGTVRDTGRPHPRNSKCFCGSGRKWKKCHGKPEPAPQAIAEIPASVQEALDQAAPNCCEPSVIKCDVVGLP